jgi:hypothetical protein
MLPVAGVPDSHGKDRDCVRVGGMGGCFGPSDYERHSKHLQGYAKRHYTRNEIEDLCRHSGIDALLVHDAPAGVKFERHRRGAGYVSKAAGLDDLISRVRPQVYSSAITTPGSTPRSRASAVSD